MGERVLQFRGARAVEAAKALGSEARSNILAILRFGPRTVSQLALELGIAQPAATNHIRILEDAGLLTAFSGTGERGSTKMCSRTYDEVRLHLSPLLEPGGTDRVSLAMPVGSFSRCEINPTCGMASANSIIGYVDDPRSFYLPDRVQAEILWFDWGFVEYEFVNPVFSNQTVDRLDFSVELCSEAPGYAVAYPSDITFSVNGQEVGIWTCPGDMGDEPGLLNPAWWPRNNTQYGFLKTLSVRDEGTFVDGIRVSDCRPEDLLDRTRPSIRFKLEVKAEARHRGGITLFGKSFGNYAQELELTLTTHPSEDDPRGKNASL